MRLAYSRRLPACVATAAVVLLSSAVQAEPPVPGSITASVVLRNARGSLACRLYKSGKNFPLATEGTLNQRVKITGTSARCTFANVQPGTYAVMVHHDENDNRKFDKNLIGMPLEGYGASNNHLPALSAPSWDDSKFVVDPGKNRALSIALRY